MIIRQMPDTGINVVLINLMQGNIVSAGNIKFTGKRFKLLLAEVLWYFDISKKNIGLGAKIWIKREGKDSCREMPFKWRSELNWEYFNNCMIVISPTMPSKEDFIIFGNKPSGADITFNKYEEQRALWDAKNQRKIERRGRIPLSKQLREKLKRKIKKRKRLAIIAKKQNIDLKKIPED